jgi:serine/threonine protein kinase/tetratricopeptide (TPR) repeat protein/TolB-like protein
MEQAHPLPGQLISHYRIVEKIGAGGMGVVYRAHDEQLDRDVALKVLPIGLLAEEGARKQFRKEALALAKLNHPNIETIFEFSSQDGMDFLAMELIRGEPLDQMLDKGPLTESELVRLGTQFAEGLAAAHEQGVIHRDLKPANLFVTPDGRIKILDFGLAKLFHPELGVDATRSVTIETGSISGTVPYMSPEQLRGLPVDVRSDIYAAGAVLFEMATGKRPYPQTQTAELMGAILLQTLPPPRSVNPNVSARLEGVIEKSLQKVPADRFQSARELRAALLGLNSAATIVNMPLPELATVKLPPGSVHSAVIANSAASVAASSATSIPAEASAPASESPKPGGPWLVIAVIAALAVIAAGCLLVGLNVHGMRDRIFPRHATAGPASEPGPVSTPAPQGASTDTPPASAPSAGETPAAPATPRSTPVVPLVGSKTRRAVAVVGFKNISGAPESAWLSTAFAEAMTSEMAGGGKLLTIPTETVAQMKTNLALSDADSYGKDVLGRIRQNVGANVVVLGGYQAGKGELRLDLKLEDTNTGEVLATATGTGKEDDLAGIAARAGSSLRDKLGAGAISGADASIVRASLPSNAQAAKLYAEGLAKMRAFDYLGAREDLQKAVAEEPSFAPAHDALAGAWASLGNDGKTRDEANQAYRLSSGLGANDKLAIEARYHESLREWGKAVEIYLGLFGSSPDNIEYGLSLADAQVRAGRAQDALATVDLLHKLPPPALNDDPRIDEMQARAAQALGDFKTERSAATRAAEKAQAEGARLVQGAALLDESFALTRMGQAKEAIAAAEESQRIYGAAGDRSHVAAGLHQVGVVLEQQGDRDGAREKFQAARLLDHQIGNQTGVANELSSAADVFVTEGFYIVAQKMYENALGFYNEAGNKDLASGALENLGDILSRHGELTEARDRYDESLTITRDTGNIAVQVADLVGISQLLYMQGDLPGAMKQLDQAAPGLQRLGDKILLGEALSGKGDIYFAGGDLAEARKAYAAALSAFQDAGAKKKATEAQVSLARVTVEDGHPGDAEAPLRQAITDFNAEKDVPNEVIARAALARALLATGNALVYVEAQKEVSTAVPLVAKLQNPRPRLEITITAARVAAALGGSGETKRTLEGALADSEKLGIVPLQFEARFAIAEAQMKVGKSGQGRFQLNALAKDATDKGFLLMARNAHTAASASAGAGHN